MEQGIGAALGVSEKSTRVVLLWAILKTELYTEFLRIPCSSLPALVPPSHVILYRITFLFVVCFPKKSSLFNGKGEQKKRSIRERLRGEFEL